MVATVLKDGAKTGSSWNTKFNNYPIPITTKYQSFHQPEARPVPVLGEVHGSLPLDGEAATPEQFLPVSVLSEVVEQLQCPVDNVTWVKVFFYWKDNLEVGHHACTVLLI